MKEIFTKKAFVTEDRQRVVGVVPLDKRQDTEVLTWLKMLMHKLNPKLGHISTSCWSVEYDNPFSLAILKDGKNMIGEKLYVMYYLKIR